MLQVLHQVQLPSKPLATLFFCTLLYLLSLRNLMLQVLHEVQLPSTPCRMALHPGSCLLAVASGDTHGIVLYDVEAQGRLVRRFNGHA